MSFLRYWKAVVLGNLACLIKNDSINLWYDSINLWKYQLMIVSAYGMESINFISNFFLWDTAKIRPLFLHPLSMLGQTHKKGSINLDKTICVYKHVQNQLHHSHEILQGYCIHVILNTSGMPDHTHQNW